MGSSSGPSRLARKDCQDARRSVHAVAAIRPRLGSVVRRRRSFDLRANSGQLIAESLRGSGSTSQGPEGYEKVSID